MLDIYFYNLYNMGKVEEMKQERTTENMFNVKLYDNVKNEFLRIENVENVTTEKLHDGYHLGIRVNMIYTSEVKYYPLERYTLTHVWKEGN